MGCMDSNGSEKQLVISAPLDTLATGTGLVKQQQQSDGDKKPLLSRLLNLFKSARPGSDLTRLQVSHHPPISALYATHELVDVRLQWWQSPCPQFCGNRVEVNVQGKRELFLDAQKEVYEMTCPKLMIRFFPTLSSEWVGESSVKCNASSLEATIFFHPNPFFGLKGAVGHIRGGHVLNSSTCKSLFDLSGSYNGM